MLLTSVCITPSHMSIHVSLLLSVCSFVLNKAFGIVCEQTAGLSDLSPLERGFIVLLTQLLFGSYRLPAWSRSFRQQCPLRQEVDQQQCGQKSHIAHIGNASSQWGQLFLLYLERIPGKGVVVQHLRPLILTPKPHTPVKARLAFWLGAGVVRALIVKGVVSNE